MSGAKVHVVTNQDVYEPENGPTLVGVYSTREKADEGALAYAKRINEFATEPWPGTTIKEVEVDA